MDKQIIISATAVPTAPTTALITAPTALPPAEQLGDYATSRNLTTSSYLGIAPQTARKFIQAYDQFGDRSTSSDLPTGKISLPPAERLEKWFDVESNRSYRPHNRRNKKTVRELDGKRTMSSEIDHINPDI